MKHLTLFNDVFDRSIDNNHTLDSWDNFVELLNTFHAQPYEKKGDSSLFSPAVYKKGTVRANDNVEYWGGWVALDIDSVTKDYNFDPIKKYDFVIYSTPSSTHEQPKFRLVFNLDSWVEKKNIRHFWFAITEEIAGISDPQTKDLSRMFYIPGNYKNKFNFFIKNEGNPIDVKQLLLDRPCIEANGLISSMLPGELYKKFINRKYEKMNNKTKYRWNSYRDCPFVSKKAVDSYMKICNTGWYFGLFNLAVSIAYSAFKRGYPLTTNELSTLLREIDGDNVIRQQERPEYDKIRKLDQEAQHAINYVLNRI